MIDKHHVTCLVFLVKSKCTSCYLCECHFEQTCRKRDPLPLGSGLMGFGSVHVLLLKKKKTGRKRNTKKGQRGLASDEKLIL